MSDERFENGDWVQTTSGDTGQVVHIARMTIFVKLANEPENASLRAYLASELTPVEPPPDD